jgi:hypothetical protein
MALDSIVVGVALPCVTGFAISFCLPWAMRPHFRLRRPANAWAVAVHLGLWTMGCAVLLPILQRPYFASFCLVTIFAVIVLVHNAKYRSLREPFVYQDFEYFGDAIRHPRLYLPFLGRGPLAVAILACVGVIWLGLALESSLALSYPVLLSACALSAVLAWGLMREGVRRLPAPSGAADADLEAYGLAGALWLYRHYERRPVQVATASPFHRMKIRPACTAGELPDLLVVQSESFFDARNLYAQLAPETLAHYDRLCATSRRHGRLEVPAWGANTVRTEFSFLTGIDLRQMGVHRFQPYRYLASGGLPTIASILRKKGYRTICVHPYHGSFYNRLNLFPMLGFDEFHDIAHFRDASLDGPYVSDVSLAQYVDSCLMADRSQPLYLHVITMENHGPLHLEEVRDEDRRELLRSAMPPGCDDLVAYARHLRNGDRMLEILTAAMSESGRPSGLCLFGDHVPIMADVYRTLGAPAGPTDYLIWTPQCVDSTGSRVDASAAGLAAEFLRVMNLI